MSEGDSTSVHVDLLLVEAKFLETVDILRREGFVDLSHECQDDEMNLAMSPAAHLVQVNVILGDVHPLQNGLKLR